MSTFRAEYKEQMNVFCNANCKITAEDILMRAKEQRSMDADDVLEDKQDTEMKSDKKDNIVHFKERKKKKKAWKALVPAACFLLIGTTTLAATGQLGDLFRYIFKDETTAEIVDEGYLYEVHQVEEEDIFKIELVAVTGDAATPKLVFDIYVNDEKVVKNNDQIRMLAYILGEEQYENELEKYGPWEAYGEKDEEVENLYHMSMTGPPVWMTSGEPVVVDIWQINVDLQNDIWTTFETNMVYRFTPPADVYHPVSYEYYEDIKFSYGGIDYYLNNATFGPYRSDLGFQYDFVGTTLSGDETDYAVLEEKLHANWLEFVDTLVLVVDGKEFKVDPNDKGYTWCDVKGENLKKNRCGITPVFPSVNYEKAESVILKAGDTSYTLK